MEQFCTYCGSPKGNNLSCCGENHWMTAQEYKDYHGDWPDDGSAEESEYYDELNRGYNQDRI